ncbi:MAG: AI-2E family transporter [Alphaproteobacteria bacterium]|nr:AI-2E family transporter [Alphaproteobacteria bacterium]
MFPIRPREKKIPRSAVSIRSFGHGAEAEQFFARFTRFSIIGLFFIGFAAALYAGQYVLAPVIAAVLVGFTLGPLNGWLERRGLSGGLAAGLIVISLVAMLGLASYSLAVPLESWSSKLPAVGTRLMDEWSKYSKPIEKIKDVEKQVNEATSDAPTTEVTIKQRGIVTDLISSAADIVARLVLFLGCLYFFLATRTSIKRNILMALPTSSMRFSSARIIRDAESFLSRYFLSIAAINLCFGAVVGIAVFLLGLPQPYLWGTLAAVLNFALYVGPALMTIILLGVGLTTFSDTMPALAPAIAFVILNFLEGQFVTPIVLGERLTLNPLAVLVSIAFWLWLWGPVGAFLAVPILIVATMIFYHVSPVSQSVASVAEVLSDDPATEVA